MVSLVKIISTALDKAKRRLPKFLRLGKSDVQTAFEAAPFGVDANPIADMIAVYAPSSLRGKTVIIGYINKNQIAAPGEHRIYSTNEAGELQTFIWLKADGQVQMGGNNDHLMRYSPLDTELQSFKTAIQAELTKIATGITGAGGTYTPGTLEIDISPAKINEIETL